MFKSKILKSSFLAGLFSVAVASVAAADIASASAILAEIEAQAVEAKAAMAAAALNGDLDQFADAKKKSDAIDAACTKARKSFAALEQYVQSGDQKAAAGAEDEMKEALSQVAEAMTGVIPEELAEMAQQQGEQEKPAAAKGPALNPPNPRDVPWKSEGVRQFYEEVFSDNFDSSTFGGGSNFGDSDATPE